MLWNSAALKFMLPVVGPDFAATDIRQPGQASHLQTAREINVSLAGSQSCPVPNCCKPPRPEPNDDFLLAEKFFSDTASTKYRWYALSSERHNFNSCRLRGRAAGAHYEHALYCPKRSK
jgi:hypothetical protein